MRISKIAGMALIATGTAILAWGGASTSGHALLEGSVLAGGLIAGVALMVIDARRKAAGEGVPPARWFRTVVLAAFVLGAGACASFINSGVGRPISAVPGTGNAASSTARDAIIRAFVGGAAGAVIGRGMDGQAKELEVAMPGAVVERFGEGIRVTFASGLLYDSDSDALRPEAANTLQGLAASLKRYPDTQLLIVAHTDATGGSDYNEDLSSRRAVAALRYLVAEGVGARRVEAIGRGEAEAVATNETEAGRERNRRIEMAIFSSPAARTVAR